MLEVDRVSLHYGAAIALRQVSIRAEIGAVTCLLGRNGVGKTSLLRAIVGAHPVTSGTIRWHTCPREYTSPLCMRGLRADVSGPREPWRLWTIKRRSGEGSA